MQKQKRVIFWKQKIYLCKRPEEFRTFLKMLWKIWKKGDFQVKFSGNRKFICVKDLKNSELWIEGKSNFSNFSKEDAFEKNLKEGGFSNKRFCRSKIFWILSGLNFLKQKIYLCKRPEEFRTWEGKSNSFKFFQKKMLLKNLKEGGFSIKDFAEAKSFLNSSGLNFLETENLFV